MSSSPTNVAYNIQIEGAGYQIKEIAEFARSRIY